MAPRSDLDALRRCTWQRLEVAVMSVVSEPGRARGWRFGSSFRWLPLVAVLGWLVIWPLSGLQRRAFSEGLGAFRRAWHIDGMGRIIFNTVALASISVSIALVMGTALAALASRLPPRAERWLGFLPVIPLVVPTAAFIVGCTFLFSPRVGLVNVWLRKTPFFSGDLGPIDLYSFYGIALITALQLTAFVYLFVFAQLRQVGAELEAAASASGARPLWVFFTITLPLLRPAIAYAAGITFLIGLGQFTAPLMLGTPHKIQVLTTVMYRTSQRYPIDYALGAVLGTPLVIAGIVVVSLQRVALRNQSRYAAVTGKGKYVPSSRSWLAALPLGLFGLVAVILPVGALIVTAFSPYWSGQINVHTFTLASWRRTLSNPRTVQAIGTTVRTILMALLFVIPLGFMSALALLNRTRLPRVLRVIVDALSSLSLSMPAALFGFALLYMYSRPPVVLYGTTTLIVIAYVTLMIPHSIRPQLSGMLALGPEYNEASAVSGAPPIRTLIHVTLPLIRRSVGVAAAIAIILLSHEFAASVMIRSTCTQVMGTLMFDVWQNGTYPDVAVVALVMTGVTMVGAILALMMGGLRALQNA